MSGVGKGLGGGWWQRWRSREQRLVPASSVTSTQATLSQGELRWARTQMDIEGDTVSLRGAGPLGRVIIQGVG